MLGIQPRALYILNKLSRDFELWVHMPWVARGQLVGVGSLLPFADLGIKLRLSGSHWAGTFTPEPLPAPSRTFYLLLFNVCVYACHICIGGHQKRL